MAFYVKIRENIGSQISASLTIFFSKVFLTSNNDVPHILVGLVIYVDPYIYWFPVIVGLQDT